MDVEVLAAPDISSASGSFNHGSTVTISGSGFGAKNPAKPLIWADFENGINPTNLGRQTTWDVIQELSLNSTGIQYGMSGQNVVGEWQPGSASHSFRIDEPYGDMYLYLKRYFDFPMTANQKFFRMFNTADTVSFSASTSNDGIFVSDCDTTDPNRFDGFTKMQNAWQSEEFRWRTGTGVSNDGLFEWVRDGVQEHLDTTVLNCNAPYGQLRTDNFTDAANLPPDGSRVYMDDIYVDTTWARVMIGNASTFAASTVREIQIPSAWSNTSITITVNRGAFTNLNNAFLYVIDSSGTPNATGFCLGGQSVTVPDVVGMTQADATTAITAVSLVVGNVMIASSSTVPVGDVISQMPGSGSLACQGSDVDLVVSGNPSSGSGGGGCFIATAAFGSPLAKEVHVLRAFRDRYLLTNNPGRLLVSQYYRFSPPLSSAIAVSEARQAVARGALRPVVWWAALALDYPAVAFGMGAIGFVVGPVFVLFFVRARLAIASRNALRRFI